MPLLFLARGSGADAAGGSEVWGWIMAAVLPENGVAPRRKPNPGTAERRGGVGFPTGVRSFACFEG